MTDITFSTCVLHCPWIPERAEALAAMDEVLLKTAPKSSSHHIITRRADRPMSEFKTILMEEEWGWALKTGASHHLFCTDDLNLAPHFWPTLHAMVTAKPDSIIGLMSNHPQGPALFRDGFHWYRCNSWIVGPAYLIPRRHLKRFFGWWQALPDTEAQGGRRWYNDDSAINEWISKVGPGESWHPLPSIIEHRADLGSTVGHGDYFSRERLSWREMRCVDFDDARNWRWRSEPHDVNTASMMSTEFWQTQAPLLAVHGCEP